MTGKDYPLVTANTFTDAMDKAVARTDELCAVDGRAARTRVLLHRLEVKGHKSGWDGDAALPEVFVVDYNPDSDQVVYRWAEPITGIVRDAMERNGGNVGAALQVVASSAERIRAGEQAPHPLAPPNPFAGMPADQDLFGGNTPGWKFYGYGLRSEGWTTPRGGVTRDSSLHQAAHERRLHEHPDRVEARVVWLAGRDGIAWHLVRRRGESPQCIAFRPESDLDFGGNIGNALGRMTNAAVGNPVPVRPVNPLFRRE